MLSEINFLLTVFSHRKKRMKNIQHKVKAGKLNVNEDDPFELFVASTNIRYCYYSETHKILGNTYGMCVLQVRVIQFLICLQFIVIFIVLRILKL